MPTVSLPKKEKWGQAIHSLQEKAILTFGAI
jgi:hypothetical protein